MFRLRSPKFVRLIVTSCLRRTIIWSIKRTVSFYCRRLFLIPSLFSCKTFWHFHGFIGKIQLSRFCQCVFLLKVGADILVWQVYIFLGLAVDLRHGTISLRRYSLHYISSSCTQTFPGIRPVNLGIASWYPNSVRLGLPLW